MFSSKRSRSFVVRAAVTAVVPLMLAACSADLGPGPIGTGYAHHGEPYKAQPGPRPVLMKQHMLDNQCKEVRQYHPNSGGGCGDMPAPVMDTAPVSGAAWDAAATDLITRMVNELGKPMENVHVLPGDEPGLETALNGAMTAHGIPVSTTPGNGPFDLQYSVQPVTGSSMVNVTLKSIGSSVHEVSGMYDVAAMTAMPAAPAEAVEPAESSDAPLPIMPLTPDASN